jgi:amino acid transporter
MNIPEEFKKPPVTLGDWIISVIVTKIPLIGFIMLIVWAVDKNTESNKANWAKAELIVKLIGFLIVILFIAIIGIGFFTNFADQVDWSDFD